jgi:hypothetical protein
MNEGNTVTTKPHWQQPWEQKHRTVKVVCVACVKISHITLYGKPNEYRELVKIQTCPHCGAIGKLNATKLAKTRVKPDTTLQESFNWGKR